MTIKRMLMVFLCLKLQRAIITLTGMNAGGSLVLVSAKHRERDAGERKRKWRGLSNPLLKKQLPRWGFVAKVVLTAEDALAVQPSLPDHTAQSSTLVGGALVAKEHSAGLDDPFGRIVEDTDVGIEANT